MIKSYVLDTNILIYDPESIFQFEDNNVYIPIFVLEEIDKIKVEQSQRGASARKITRNLDELKSGGKLNKGIKLDNGGTLTVYVPKERKKLAIAITDSIDCAILQSVIDIKENLPSSKTDVQEKVILVTLDLNLRVRAEAIDIQTATYENNRVHVDDLNNNPVTIDVSKENIDEFYSNKFFILDENIPENTSLILRNDKQSALARFSNGKAKALTKKEAFGITHRNKEQQFAIDMLLNPEIELVTIMGLAGGGKTLLSVAAGLSQVMDGQYSKLTISRPIVPMGKDIGYLPGPQPLDAKILTPNGWTTMGQLKIGDKVISRNGKPTKILNIYPKGIKEVYKVTTTDGTSTECCEDHLWLTTTIKNRKRNKKGSIKTAKEISNSLFNNKLKIQHHIPRNEPVNFINKKLPLKPYTLGALLGDGTIVDNIIMSNTDYNIINRISEEVKSLNCNLVNTNNTINYCFNSNLTNNKPARKVCLTNLNSGISTIYHSTGEASKILNINSATINYRCENKSIINHVEYKFKKNKNRWQNPIKNHIYNLGLLGCKAKTKFIPSIYKYSSIDDRLNLLRGLMDTDGSVKNSGEASFTTISKQLALDVIEIVRSLGGRATLCSRNRVGKKRLLKNNKLIITKNISYEFTISLPEKFNPFYTSKKASKFRCKYIHGVGISSIEKSGEKEVQCILVENPEHLYITDNFIVTHNTVEEKLDPWMKPIFDNIDYLMMSTKKQNRPDNIEDIVQIEPLTYVRGRTLPNQFILIDEAQNISPHEAKSIVTRCGEGSKIVLTGDVQQIDNPYLDERSNGLSVLIKKLNNHKKVAHIRLSKGERSSLATLAADVL